MPSSGAAPGDVLTAEHVLEYTYTRSVGPVIGRFFTGLREQRIEGIRARDGRVICPPTEYDPATGEQLDDWVPVADAGEITSWTWVAEPRPEHPLAEPFAWALIRLDGSDTAMLHAVGARAPDAVRTGARVRARWRAERRGHITDIECFEVVE
ncbi:MAG TPA: OB-fold domain-containing protein [Actinomycetota bacterium]